MRYAYHPEAVWEEEDACVFATAPTIGEVVVLNGSAALIWYAIDGATPSQIAAYISEATATDEAQILPHLTPFLTDLERRRLVVSSDE